jgi:NAD(P)-dependent dehydrogenase (short-subunit alcohol dehydrogenase family)
MTGPSPVLVGKTALVTGATSGLGRAIAEALAEAGADLVLTSRRQEACAVAAAEIAAVTGRRVEPVACHVGRWAELPGLVDRAYAAFGHIDVLVNCAGIAPAYPSLADLSEDLFDKVMAVNAKGPLRLAALVGARMSAAAGGSIINVSAVGAIRPSRDALPYSMAKAALDVATVGLAQEYAPAVRVNSLMPGLFSTGMARHWSDDFRSGMAARTLLGRVGEPAEIVAAALYLASDASRYTTGTVLRVDGGLAVGG